MNFTHVRLCLMIILLHIQCFSCLYFSSQLSNHIPCVYCTNYKVSLTCVPILEGIIASLQALTKELDFLSKTCSPARLVRRPPLPPPAQFNNPLRVAYCICYLYAFVICYYYINGISRQRFCSAFFRLIIL